MLTPTAPPPTPSGGLTADEALDAAIAALNPQDYPGPRAAAVRTSLQRVQQEHQCAGRCMHLLDGQPECPDAHLARHLLAVL